MDARCATQECFLCVEAHLLGAVRRELDGAREFNVFNDTAYEALLRLVCQIRHCRLHSNVGGIGLRQRQVGRDQRIFHRDRASGGEINLAPNAAVAISNRGNPVPAQGAEKCWAVDCGDAPVLADAIADSVFMRNAGMWAEA